MTAGGRSDLLRRPHRTVPLLPLGPLALPDRADAGHAGDALDLLPHEILLVALVLLAALLLVGLGMLVLLWVLSRRLTALSTRLQKLEQGLTTSSRLLP